MNKTCASEQEIIDYVEKTTLSAYTRSYKPNLLYNLKEPQPLVKESYFDLYWSVATNSHLTTVVNVDV